MVILGIVVKGRPWVYLQPEVPGLSILVHNMATEPIVIKSFQCEPLSLFVGRSHETRDITEAKIGVPLNAVIPPQSKHSFSVLTNAEWDEVAPDREVVITLRWSLTRCRWLPQVPIRVSTTVRFVKAVMRLTRHRSSAPVCEIES